MIHSRQAPTAGPSTPRARRAFGLYLVLLAFLTVTVLLATGGHITGVTDRLGTIMFLVILAVALNQLLVPVERGFITLSAIACQAAAATTSPLATAVVVLAPGIFAILRRMKHEHSFGLVGIPTIGVLAAGLREAVSPWIPNHTGQFAVAIVTYSLLNWIAPAIGMGLRRGEPAYSVWRKNVSVAWFGTFAYFGVSALVMAELLDGSLRGFALATGVAVLALALTDTLAGRRHRSILESQLSDADRHFAYTRAVEGVVHNLRNHIAVIVGELQELDARRKSGVSLPLLTTIRTAAEDAASALRNLTAGASPRVRIAADPVDLRELGTQPAGLARPTARLKRVQLAVKGSPNSTSIRGDPLLLREVVSNLLLNAIDAAPEGGSVTVSTGLRPDGQAFLSVADNGPGFPEESRNRLFEPHFTTKPSGTGMGLFTSYGIVREHRGQLLYEGGKRGAVFTILLPPAGS